MLDITYRSFIESDAQQVKKIAIISWKYTYKNIFNLEFIENFVNVAYDVERLKSCINDVEIGRSFFYVALDSKNQIGFCQVSILESEAILSRIYILPSYLGKGIGFKLLQLAEKFLIEKKIKQYYCYVHKNNKLGLKFYQNQNFVHKEEKDKIDEDEMYLEKKII